MKNRKFKLIRKENDLLYLEQDGVTYKAQIKTAVDIGSGIIEYNSLKLDYFYNKDVYLCDNLKDLEVYTIAVGIYAILVFKQLI